MVKALAVDVTKCRGCFSCAIACSTVNTGTGDIGASRIKVTPFWDEAFFVPLTCLQCEKPYCALVCPANALVKNSETGVVEFNKEKCIGCKLCVMACPFGNINVVGHYPSKCDLCGGDPTCVKVCDWEALKFCDVEQISDGRRALTSERIRKYQETLLQTMKGESKSEKTLDSQLMRTITSSEPSMEESKPEKGK